MSAGFNSNTGVLKKYVAIHPEAQPRLDAQFARLERENAVMKEEVQKWKSGVKNDIKE